MKYVIFEEGLGICVVKAPTLIETHTSTDPEVEDRKVLHVMYRRGLTPWPRSTVKGYQSKPLWRYLIGF